MRRYLAACILIALGPTLPATAQGDHAVDKNYAVNGRAMLQVTVDNASIQTESCGSCNAVHVHVDMHDAKLSDYKLEEFQSGNTVHFSLKQKDSAGPGSYFRQHRGPEVHVQVPSTTDANIRSSNGSLTVAGLHGTLDIRSDNGSIHLADTEGALRAETTNGSLSLQHVAGSLRLSTTNGAVNGDARADSLNVQTSNGSTHLRLLDGSSLRDDATLTAGNGSVELRMANSIRAEVNLDSGVGSVHSDLPLTGQSSDEGRHHLRGNLNGGGHKLHITTGNGSIALLNP